MENFKEVRGVFLFFMLFLFGGLGAQDISGYWEGNLKITSRDSLRFGMFIEQTGDSLHVELDSPDQYAFGMPTQQVRFLHDTLSWKASSLNASFKGMFHDKAALRALLPRTGSASPSR